MAGPNNQNSTPSNIGLAHARRGATLARVKTRDEQRRSKRLTERLGVMSYGVSGERAGKDYTDAHNYITDYYNDLADIAEDIWEAARDGIAQFVETSSIPEERLTDHFVFKLIGAVLDVVPSLAPVKTALSALATGGEVVKQLVAVAGEREATDAYAAAASRAGSSQEAARGARDFVKAMAPLARQAVIEQRKNQRAALELYAGQHPEMRGALYAIVVGALGPQPKYNAATITAFGTKYEIELYKTFYAPKAHVEVMSHIDRRSGRTQGSRTTVRGVPDAVLGRLVTLTGAASYEAAVLDWNLPREYRSAPVWHGR